MATFEKATVGEKISNYVENRQNVLIAILAVVVAAVIAYTVAVTVTSKANTKGLAAIDTISYVMTQESASLSEEELEMRRNKALEDLSAYLEKGGIVGGWPSWWSKTSIEMRKDSEQQFTEVDDSQYYKQ